MYLSIIFFYLILIFFREKYMHLTCQIIKRSTEVANSLFYGLSYDIYVFLRSLHLHLQEYHATFALNYIFLTQCKQDYEM